MIQRFLATLYRKAPKDQRYAAFWVLFYAFIAFLWGWMVGLLVKYMDS